MTDAINSVKRKISDGGPSIPYGMDYKSGLALDAHYICNIVVVRTSVRSSFAVNRDSVRWHDTREGGFWPPLRRSPVPFHVGSRCYYGFCKMAPLPLVQETEEQVGQAIQIHWSLERKSGLAVDSHHNGNFVGGPASG